MSFTIEEQDELKALYGIDIPELLIEGYTEEQIREVLDQGQMQEQVDITSTAPIEQEEINLPSSPVQPQIQPQPQPDTSLGLEVDVDQLLNEGYTMDQIQAVAKNKHGVGGVYF